MIPNQNNKISNGSIIREFVSENVLKHGSHDQSTHGKKGPKGPKGPESEGTPASPAYTAALGAAKAGGASQTEIRRLENAHKKGNQDTLEEIEIGAADAHADWSRADGADSSVANTEAKGAKLLQAAAAMALRDVTGEGADTWPTLDEMENM